MPSDQQKNHFSSQKFVDLSHQIFKPRLIGQTYTNYRRPLSVVFSFMYAGLENLKIHVSCLLIFERMIKIDQRKKKNEKFQQENFSKKCLCLGCLVPIKNYKFEGLVSKFIELIEFCECDSNNLN